MVLHGQKRDPRAWLMSLVALVAVAASIAARPARALVLDVRALILSVPGAPGVISAGGGVAATARGARVASFRAAAQRRLEAQQDAPRAIVPPPAPNSAQRRHPNKKLFDQARTTGSPSGGTSSESVAPLKLTV